MMSNRSFFDACAGGNVKLVYIFLQGNPKLLYQRDPFNNFNCFDYAKYNGNDIFLDSLVLFEKDRNK